MSLSGKSHLRIVNSSSPQTIYSPLQLIYKIVKFILKPKTFKIKQSLLYKIKIKKNYGLGQL